MGNRESEDFGQRLKTVREMRELSQAELAEKARLQPSAVSHFETGTRKPSFDNLRRLADALKVTTDYLLGRVDEPTAVTAGADAHFRDYELLSDRNRDVVDQMIQTLKQRAPK